MHIGLCHCAKGGGALQYHLTSLWPQWRQIYSALQCDGFYRSNWRLLLILLFGFVVERSTGVLNAWLAKCWRCIVLKERKKEFCGTGWWIWFLVFRFSGIIVWIVGSSCCYSWIIIRWFSLVPISNILCRQTIGVLHQVLWRKTPGKQNHLKR